MAQDIQRAAIDLYDRFTHEGMDRRDFMARLTRIAGSAAAASILLADIAAKAAAQPQVAADDRRLVTRTMAWEARPGRRYRGYSATPSATASAMSSWPIIVRARSSSPAGVPPAGLSQSGASAAKPASAKRRATSRIWSLRPRFSWMTTITGGGPRPSVTAGAAL